MAKTYVISAFIGCLVLSFAQGKLAKSHKKLAEKFRINAELRNGRLKPAENVSNNVNSTNQDGRHVQQASQNNKSYSTNSLLKRTMQQEGTFSLKNAVSVEPRRHLKLLRLKTASPFQRSRLTSLRSSTFKPIHIYGSVPFKSFLSALSKSNSQEAISPPSPPFESALPQNPEMDSSPSQLLLEKALQRRQLQMPVVAPMLGAMPGLIGFQGAVPMFLDEPRVGFNGLPLEGAVPMFPPVDMANFYNAPLGHHHVTHHLHRKVFTHAKCFPNPCQNGGSCTAFSTSYECSCPVGFKGHSCEERNQCVPNPCKNGGNCYDDEDNYKCTCVRGFTGYNCEEMSKCVPNPCKNGATCLEAGESYQCECPEHFDGSHCEVHDYCGQENPCLNGGRCENNDDGYECKCDHGYRGHDCAEFDVCHENPCDNGGICSNIEGNQFTCKCSHGYHGVTCEEKVPPCDLDPCSNGGTCVEETDNYICHCPERWRGKTCEDPIHTPCSGNLCENGGKCVELDYGDYKCQCPHEFGGMHCEVQAQPVCYSCHEHATCKNDKCECMDGYQGNGEYCEALSHCHPNPCYNGGVCHDHSSDYECICADGFMGKTCQEPKPCLASPCLNGGTCVDRIGSSCIAGMPCDSHGYECTCPIDFRGSNCEHPSFCHPNPCQNGGECVSEATTYICQCPIRYSGQNCDVDKCGSCDVNANCDKGNCVCDPGFVGQGTKGTCKPSIPTTPTVPPTTPVGFHPGRPPPTPPVGLSPPQLNKCQPNPCQNGGTCIPLGSEDLACKCPPAFTGKLCTDTAKSFCHPSPCLNGGICMEAPTGYQCQCVGHYRGINCQEDDCDRCDIRAVCVKGKCKCRVGYIGDGYECTKAKKCGGCSPHATCKVSQCVCNIGYTGDGTNCKPVGCSDCPSNSKCVYGICVCLPDFFFDGKNCAAPSKSCSSNCTPPSCEPTCPTTCCTQPPPPPPPPPPVPCPAPCQYQCTNQCPATCCEDYFSRWSSPG